MQHKVPYTVEANGAVYFRIKKNVYNFYIIILEMIIQLRNHSTKRTVAVVYVETSHFLNFQFDLDNEMFF